MADNSLSAREKQSIAIISKYILDSNYYIDWNVAINFSGVEFDWTSNNRLVRAQSFKDPDYENAINRALQSIYLADRSGLTSLLGYIFDGVAPEERRLLNALSNLQIIQGDSRDILIPFNSPLFVHPDRSITCTPIFNKRDLEVDEELVFMLMPFQPAFNRLYEDHLKPTLDEYGLNLVKADEIFNTGAIMEDVWIHICKAKFIIADVTGRNPNVFYELGIAHTIGKEVILITQSSDDVPFDLRHLRYFPYDDNAQGWETLKVNLRRIIPNI